MEEDFDFGEYLMEGFREAIGKKSNYWVRINSGFWFDKQKLTLENLAELDALIVEKDKPIITPTEEEIVV